MLIIWKLPKIIAGRLFETPAIDPYFLLHIPFTTFHKKTFCDDCLLSDTKAKKQKNLLDQEGEKGVEQ